MTVTLGTNKIVELKPWKAKTKKDFIRIFKDRGDKVNEEDIVKILVKPYVDNPGFYYSPDELQLILVELRKMSIDDKVEFTMDCDNKDCGKPINVKLTLDEITKYQPSQYPVEMDGILWDDIKNPQSVKEHTKKFPDEPVREVTTLLHIKKYNDVNITKFSQMLEIADNMTLAEREQLEENYDKVRSKIDIKTVITCPHCGNVTDYNFDIIPGFFDPLLPKQ